MKHLFSLICLVLAFLTALLGGGSLLGIVLEDLIFSGLLVSLLLITGWLMILSSLLLWKKGSKSPLPSQPAYAKVKPTEAIDQKKRLFLKTLGTLGFGGLFYLLFTKKAQALQFGGTGVPDPIGIKDASGTQITGATRGSEQALSVQIIDSSGNQISTFGSASYTTYVSTTITLTSADTAYLLPSSEQSGRVSLTIENNSDTNIYIGDSSVTTSTGILLNPNDVLVIKAESGVYGVCGTNSKTVNCLEAK